MYNTILRIKMSDINMELQLDCVHCLIKMNSFISGRLALYYR